MPHDGKQSIDDEAVYWFVLLNDEEATDEQRRQFALWRNADSRHDVAWQEVQRMWGGLDQLADAYARSPGISAAPSVMREADAGSSRVPSGQVVHLDAHRPAPERTRRLLSRRWMAAAAGIALAFGIGWQLMPVGLTADYRSGVGERMMVRLDDGSEVELSTGTAMNVSFTDNKRTVTLLAGEAFFTVAKDPRRPFAVIAKQGEIEVLGTAFNVRIDHDVTVAVAHNVVEVSAASDHGIRVAQGEMVHFDRSGVSPVQPANLETALAWRSHSLVFADVPLSEVFAELQRYRTGYIHILSSDIGQKRVTAVFDTRRIDEAIATIAESYDLKITRLSDLWVGVSGN